MNKQEVINQIKKFSELDPNYPCAINRTPNVIHAIEQLDEPQKVKVPAYVAEWIERNKSGDVQLIIILKYFGQWYEMNENENLNDEICKWVIENSETFMRAWLDGYEVEEEPKWVVKVGNLYFCGWEDTTAQFVMNTVLGEDESIIKYKNEGTASSVAKNLGGTVEKV